MRGGFTLLECTLAGALLCLLAVALLKGVGVTTRVARENAERLSADAVAWDALWTAFNADFDRLGSLATADDGLTLSEAAAPDLYNAAYPAALKLWVSDVPGFASLKSLTAAVEWGVPPRRNGLTNFVYRSSLRRVPWQ